MSNRERILRTENFVRQRMKEYDSGHDWWHIVRVRKLASFINGMEALASPFLVDVAALLHDVADSKFAGDDIEKQYSLIGEFLTKNEMSEISDQVLTVIRNISYSNKKKPVNNDDPLLWIIQDADRLDAIGAIGIARAFNYGGFRNNPIYIPDVENNPGKSTIGHFYEKLLKLKDLMNTPTGRAIAGERHKILELFLEQFYNEWNLITINER